MCGIAGKYVFSTDQVNTLQIKKMCDTLIHRGPDDEGIFVKDGFGFGMRRLSIIDLNTGHQPIFSSDGKLGLVFNGEIYNYIELREELIKRGYKFSTLSDTETIMHLYEEYGLEFISKLNGMFAIAIYNLETNELILIRDRIGIKPLYYYLDKHKLIFASELKAILVDNIDKKLSNEAINLYFSLGFIPNPHSIFANINKLDPGHFLIVNKEGIKKQKYWSLDFTPNNVKSLSQFNIEFKELFEDSIKLRMRSDVPFGAFLSGGIDSSLIVAFMSQISQTPINTFSIGFSDSKYHDETQFAEIVANKYNTIHTPFYINSASLIENMDMYVNHFDEPFADYSGFPTYTVSRLAKDYVKVVLTGDGGDEIFAGYKRHYAELIGYYLAKMPEKIRNKFILRIIKSISGFNKSDKFSELLEFAIKKIQMLNYDEPTRYFLSFNHNYFNSAEINQVISNDFTVSTEYSQNTIIEYWQDFADLIGNRLYVDVMTKLPEDMLTKVDRMTMANSIEARVPFLDYRIVELAATIPTNQKISLFKMKKFLKNFSKDYLPHKITSRHKHGFSSPIDKWFRHDIKDFVQDNFNNNSLIIKDILNYDYIRKLFNEHLSGQRNLGDKLFTILAFQLWYNKYGR